MKKLLRHWKGVALGAAAALSFSSCAYDPYYTSVGGSYSSGYGDGYGYGGSNFTSSVFVSTGDARWGYDPYCYSYYDYNRRCYYDPYLNGYYPVGYRPPVVVGVPHPHDWHPGREYCPPPTYVRNTTVVNYRNREDLYRRTNYDWAPQVRRGPYSAGAADRRPTGNAYDQRPSANDRRPSAYDQRSSSGRPTVNQGGSQRPPSGNRPTANGYQNDTRPSKNQGARLPQSYNTPVNRQDQRQTRPSAGQNARPQPQNRPQPQQRQAPAQRGLQEDKRPANPNQRVRGIGQA
jgi:hypothetical protein